MMRILPIVALLWIAAELPGCIAWEIRDEMRTTNEKLGEMNPTLVRTMQGVEETNRKMELVQAQLGEVQTLLRKTDEQLALLGGNLGRTDPGAAVLDDGVAKLGILREVNTTLKEVQKTLAPLSGLGGAMSFLGLGEDSHDLLADEEKAVGAKGSGKGDVAAGAPAAGAEADAADPKASKRPDPLLGTWVMVYPPPEAAARGGAASTQQNVGRITIVMADRQFLTAEDGRAPLKGRWVRQGRSLTFTFEGAPGGKAGEPESETVELLTLNSRTMTVRRGDVIRVHRRP